MMVDSLMLAAVVQEINGVLAGGIVRKVQAIAPVELALSVQRRDKRKVWLIISAHTRYAHVGWCDGSKGFSALQKDSHPETERFAETLRRHLERARFVGIEQVDFDRLVILRFVNMTPVGERKRYALWCEIMGKHSNAILVDEDTNLIVDGLKRLSSSVNRYREVLPDKPYIRPPTGGRRDPVTLDYETFTQLLQTIREPISKWLARNFFGMSDWLIALLMEHLSGATDAEALWGALTWLRETVQQGKFEPRAWRYADGAIVQCYPLPLPLPVVAKSSIPDPQSPIPEVVQCFGPVLAEWLHEKMSREVIEQHRQSFLGAVQRAIANLMQRLDELQTQWQEAQKAERYRHWGELLLTYAHAIPKGVAEVEVIDYNADPPQTVTIPLPQSRLPVEAARYYFALYRKLKSAAEVLPAVIEGLKRQQIELAQLAERVQTASETELSELTNEAKAKGLWREQMPSAQKAESSEKFLRFTVVGGHEVWVGRNVEANANLLRFARPNDLWFHVKGAPGAHALLRVNKRGEQVPTAAIEQAAQLAAHFSSRRTSSWVEVDYTFARYVRPAKGKKGLALYTNFKTVAVEPKLPT